MTTSFSLLVRGDLWAGLAAQPVGAILFAGLALTGCGALFGAVSGRIPLRFDPFHVRGTTLAAAGLTLVLGWFYKIAVHAY